MGRDICHPPGSFILWGWVNTFYVFGFSRIPGNVQFFSGEYTSLKKYFGGLGRRNAHHFGQMDFIHLAKGVVGTPCKAYISANFRSNMGVNPSLFAKNVWELGGNPSK